MYLKCMLEILSLFSISLGDSNQENKSHSHPIQNCSGNAELTLNQARPPHPTSKMFVKRASTTASLSGTATQGNGNSTQEKEW